MAPSSQDAAVERRGERTRHALVTSAEALFAERGFEATRLEDVALAVGIKRASIVYYFRDKAELYDAVLAHVFGGLREQLEQALESDDDALVAVERAVGTWVDAVGRRPSIAKLLLREVADAGRDRGPALLPHLEPFFAVVESFLARHRADPRLGRAPVGPAHVASTIAGSTVFFVAALVPLVPNVGFDPLNESHLRRHRDEVLNILRLLLGVGGAELSAPSEPANGGRDGP